MLEFIVMKRNRCGTPVADLGGVHRVPLNPPFENEHCTTPLKNNFPLFNLASLTIFITLTIYFVQLLSHKFNKQGSETVH